jgi:integrase
MIYQRTIAEDFTAEIPRPKMKKKFIQKYTQTDIYRLFRTCDITTEIGLRNASILICLVFCGLRSGEVCGLTMDDIVENGKNLDINISDELGKKGSFRTVYLWRFPSIMLREWYSIRIGQGATVNDLVFVSYRNGRGVHGNPIDQKDIDRLVKRMARQSGIRKARTTAHMFRATHINDLRNIRGYDTPAIADRVGHKDISTTDRYIARRGRIPKYYPSLSAYWSEFPKTWTYSEEDNNV